MPDIVHLHRELPQASTTARLLHHLGQEIVSAEALERFSTQAVRRRHALMITDAPAWEQVEEHLEHGPDDPEVADRLRTLVTLIDSSDIPAINSRRRRLILALCELGEVPLAARALQLTAPTPPRPDRSWLASWSDVLRPSRRGPPPDLSSGDRRHLDTTRAAQVPPGA
ncbi:hypothetical protein [Aeromicrobium sp. UC242_57]|uniref:hypothetical protein n=1 Tax=Aeromicrobium sp. UC242_57 TaxID=3374624 RepID=UPI0037A256D0